MAVEISTNDNDIKNNYNNNMIKARVRIEREVGDEWTWGRDCKQQRLTDGRCVLFKMSIRQLHRDACLIRSQFQH